jgi:hypothetical protein
MANLLKLDWHGKPIKRRAQDDWFDLTAIVAASNAHTGKRVRLVEWLRNEDTQRFLRALSKETGLPVSLADAKDQHGPEGENSPLLDHEEKTPKEAFSALIEQRGKGSHVWGHKTAALRLCAWLDADLEVKVYSWVQAEAERSRRPRALDAAGAKVVADRRAANRTLSAVAHERNVPPFMVHDAKVQGLTGKQPRAWAQELGTERWQETAPLGHMHLQALASQAAANSCARLDAEASSKRHYIAASREAGSDLRAFAEKYDLPYQPTYDGPAFTSARVKRVLADEQDNPRLPFEP